MEGQTDPPGSCSKEIINANSYHSDKTEEYTTNDFEESASELDDDCDSIETQSGFTSGSSHIHRISFIKQCYHQKR